MVRWRYCFILAMLLLLPLKTSSEEEEDDEAEEENDDNDSDDGDEEESSEKPEPRESIGRRAPVIGITMSQSLATRTIPKRPLDCYVCAYKSEALLRSCLDPAKYRVHTMTCHNVEEKCFTSVINKGNNYEAIMRGCRSGCVGSPEVTCCELNRCNNQPFALPMVAPRVLASTTSKSAKALPQTVLFFVTVLLVLQTVVKVAV